MVVRELELDLDAFEGPFDLLLTLVLKEELELVDVEVASIVLTFVETLDARGALDLGASDSTPSARPVGADGSRAEPVTLEAGIASDALGPCGEFLVLVASLLELKARGLFPDDDADAGELGVDEAAEELARRLAEYRRVKAGAAWLAERLDTERDRFFRLGPAPLAPPPARPLARQDPAALAAVLRALAQEPPAVSLAHLSLRVPPVERFLERFRALLRRRSRVSFDTEVVHLSRLEQAVAFLALLELRRTDEVALEQAQPLGPIVIARRAEQESPVGGERRAEWTARSA